MWIGVPSKAVNWNWQFADATAMLDLASDVLDQRTAVESAASAAGMDPPEALRTAFEGEDGFDPLVRHWFDRLGFPSIATAVPQSANGAQSFQHA